MRQRLLLWFYQASSQNKEIHRIPNNPIFLSHGSSSGFYTILCLYTRRFDNPHSFYSHHKRHMPNHSMLYLLIYPFFIFLI